jgi:DNA-binding CsgD family transcriptional regulator
MAERMQERLFGFALRGVVATAVTSAALLPLRAGRSPLLDVAYVGCVACGALASLGRHEAVRVAIVRRTTLQAAVAVVAAVGVSAISAGGSELWLVSCGLLCLLAGTVPLPRAIGFCTLVLVANLCEHLADGDLRSTPPVAIIGLWIGLPFWTVAIGATRERVERYILRVNQRDTIAAPAEPVVSTREGGWVEPDPPQQLVATRRRTDRLTPRELEVLLLLADGHSQELIATRLSITTRAVQRHAHNARDKVGAKTNAELVGIARVEGLVSSGGARRA